MSKDATLKTDGRCFYAAEPPSAWFFLPKVQELLVQGWHRHLPAEAGVLFIGLAILEITGCSTAKEQWNHLKRWLREAKLALITPEQFLARKDLERRFDAAYGKPWRNSLKGLLAVLCDLGLVMPSLDETGGEWYTIPNTLPAPEERLSLSETDEIYLYEYRRKVRRAQEMHDAAGQPPTMGHGRNAGHDSRS